MLTVAKMNEDNQTRDEEEGNETQKAEASSIVFYIDELAN